VPASDGTTDFSVLQKELKGRSTKIVLVAFDLLYLNGYDLRAADRAQGASEEAHREDRHPVQRELRGQRERDVRPCLQGRAGRRRLQGPRQPLFIRARHDWVKKTCAQRETLTIAGFALDGNDWDGIYVGRRKGKDLVYAGKVDHGFDKKSAADLRKRLTPLIRKTQPYTKRIAHKGIWVEPELNAEIEYRAKSAEGKVRHPFFRGLREDL
jgi:bifunctional non-homologous end joining protein LigD